MRRSIHDFPVLRRAAFAAFALLLPAIAQATTPDADLRLSLQKFFSSGITLHGASAQLISVERWPDASGAMSWHLPPLRGHPGRFSLIAEQSGKRWYVPVRVHWWAMAIVMDKSVSARSLLFTSMLKKTRTDIAGHRGHWWTKAGDLKGMRLTRPLQEGDVIFSSFVKQPPLIKRGDIVQIFLDAGAIHIRTEGKALASAGRGERIMVKNLRSRETVQAIAEDSGVVRIALSGNRG